jgi:hypothetical protein
MTGVM